MQNESIEKYFVQQEIIQAYVRLIFIVLLTLALVYFAFNGERTSIAYTNHSYLIAGVIFFIDLFHLIGLKKFPNVNPKIRKYFILHIDIISVFIGMWVFDQVGVIFSAIFIWLIIGYTIRFGEKFLVVSMLSSLIAIFMLSWLHPYWSTHPTITLSVAFATMIIPIFVTMMTREVNKKNIELHRLLKESDFEANHDHLTRLPNRALFYKELQYRVDQAAPFALLFVDLDGFKAVNDRYGHETGDEVLITAAERMKQCLEKDHFIARLGGDEFVIIAPSTQDKLERLSQKLIHSIAQHYSLHERIEDLTASIGISRFPDDTSEPFLMKKYADRAMYAAKNQGKNRFLFYTDIPST